MRYVQHWAVRCWGELLVLIWHHTHGSFHQLSLHRVFHSWHRSATPGTFMCALLIPLLAELALSVIHRFELQSCHKSQESEAECKRSPHLLSPPCSYIAAHDCLSCLLFSARAFPLQTALEGCRVALLHGSFYVPGCIVRLHWCTVARIVRRCNFHLVLFFPREDQIWMGRWTACEVVTSDPLSELVGQDSFPLIDPELFVQGLRPCRDMVHPCWGCDRAEKGGIPQALGNNVGTKIQTA